MTTDGKQKVKSSSLISEGSNNENKLKFGSWQQRGPVRKTDLPANFTLFPRSSCLLSCIKQLLSALHAGHGLHILTPVSHFFSLQEEIKSFMRIFLLVFLDLYSSSSCSSSSSIFYPSPFSVTTFTFSSSFFTVLRLALKSAFMSLEVSVQAPSMSSVVFFTLLRLGFLMPFSSTIFWFSEMIWATEEGISFRTVTKWLQQSVAFLGSPLSHFWQLSTGYHSELHQQRLSSCAGLHTGPAEEMLHDMKFHVKDQGKSIARSPSVPAAPGWTCLTAWEAESSHSPLVPFLLVSLQAQPPAWKPPSWAAWTVKQQRH